MKRLLAPAATLALAVTLLAAPSPAALVEAPAGAEPRRVPARHLDLPDGFQPEGIAVRGQTAYLGSRADGRIVRLDLRDGTVRRLAAPSGTPSLGMKVDPRDRLWVAGGSGGDLRVHDADTGRVLRRYQLLPPGDGAFVNDLVLTRGAVWVTDSANAVLFRLRFGPGGRLPAVDGVQEVPLRGQWRQVDGETNANGITTTPDGRALLVVNSTTGTLYRVARGTGRAVVVDLRGRDLVNGDGMLLEGRRLYVVQNRLDRITRVRVDRHGRSATVVGRLTSGDFDVPTTLARRGERLFTPNARFTTEPTPTTAYWVSGVRA